ncbi:MAG: DHH family phosphoesterase [Lachnospiraceae bacterium]|nr:DHH family phosphoesterase [Lachnospiraceae bacterium]
MNRFEEIVRNIKGDMVYIQTHNFPDPDAIASAFGLSELLKYYRIKSSICYKGKIERFSTNGFINKLGIELIDLDTIDGMSENDEIILVDSQKGNSNIVDAPGNEIICIDHHPSFENCNTNDYRYADIRPEYGACSTIIAQYYLENNLKMDKRVATALIFGIKSDTMGLSRGVSQADVDVYQELFKICDMELISSLEHCSLKFDDLKAYANAINSIKIYDNISFANTGYNCPEALIASISDFMLDLVEIDFTVVYSIRDDGIKLSVRSIGEINAGIVTNDALSGIGGGGGHAEMAGGFVPLETGVSHREVSLMIDLIEERFLGAIGNNCKESAR